MKLAYILFLLIYINVNSQNLVNNPSFENYTSCPINGGEIYFVNYWASPTNGTPDYFNTCNQSSLSVPQNGIGFEQAKVGVAYSGIYTFNYYGINIREYIQTELIDSLTKNKNYYIEFYVSLADSFQFATNSLGAYLSNEAISNYNEYLLSYEPQVKNTNNSLAVKDGWVKIYGTFKANGGEKYLTIGNFMPDSLSDTVFVGGGKPSWKFAYYYIDAVTVMLDTTVGVSEEVRVENEKFNIYPNPAKDEIIIEFSENITNTSFNLYTLLGKKVLAVNLINSNKFRLSIEKLETGIYTYSIENNRLNNSYGKLIIIK